MEGLGKPSPEEDKRVDISMPIEGQEASRKKSEPWGREAREEDESIGKTVDRWLEGSLFKDSSATEILSMSGAVETIAKATDLTPEKVNVYLKEKISKENN